ncbi:MAG: hypothetical protein AB7N80_05710 [Bdellovibrionales bacterium]
MIAWFGRQLILLWFFIALILCWEYLALNYSPGLSLLLFAKIKWPYWAEVDFSTKPGKPISYALGWIGFGFMVSTNFYILRKRLGIMQKWGNPSVWLDYHIFCGLIGPTLIIFHTDFKVRGLVAISFWSMMIVAGSGILGRYLYMKVLIGAAELRGQIQEWDKKISTLITSSKKNVTEAEIAGLKGMALQYAGATPLTEEVVGLSGLFKIVWFSVVGDIKIFFSHAGIGRHLHPLAPIVLLNYATTVRRELTLEPFRRLLGYWHAFHVPFTFAMYITAIIHIVVVSLLRV